VIRVQTDLSRHWHLTVASGGARGSKEGLLIMIVMVLADEKGNCNL